MERILSMQEIEGMDVQEIADNIELVNRSLKLKWDGSNKMFDRIINEKNPTIKTMSDIDKLTTQQVQDNLEAVMCVLKSQPK